MADRAPIALFIFKRAEHLERTIRSLQQCTGFADSRIVVFGDGPRNSLEVPAVEGTRAVAKRLLGPSAEYHFRTNNHGLAQSIIDGVGDLVSRFDRVIVIEDDLEVGRNFLDYMNAALERYDTRPEVLQISAHTFNVRKIANRRSAIFLPFTTTWGWATWRRAWAYFDADALGWERLQEDPSLRNRFNLDGTYDYSTMLEHQMNGHADSWGIRWYWSVFNHSGVACFPPSSLVRNIGMDGSGTHGRGLLRRFKTQNIAAHEELIVLPDRVTVERDTFDLIRRAIWRQHGGWAGAAADWTRRVLRVLGAEPS